MNTADNYMAKSMALIEYWYTINITRDVYPRYNSILSVQQMTDNGIKVFSEPRIIFKQEQQ